MCSFQKYTKRSGFYSSEFCRCLHFLADPVCGCDPQIFCGAVNGEFVGIENYRTIFANKAFVWQQATHFGSSEVPLLVVLSLIIAVLLAGQKRFTQILKVSFFCQWQSCSISGTSGDCFLTIRAY